MHAFLDTPFEALRWTSQDIADAVPLRLHELDLFDAADAARDGALPAANGARARLRIAHGYRADDALAPRFRIS